MVDEQLVGYRGTAPGCTYIPSNRRKYGVKIFWLCKAKSGLPLNANVYVEKVSNEVHRNLGKDVVLELCQPYNGSGQDVVTDNFFTSHSLAVDLLKVNLTLGTIHCNRKKIPIELLDKKRQRVF